MYDQCFNSEKNIVPLEYPSRIFPFMHLIKRFTLRVLTDGINKFEAIKNFMLAEDFQLVSEIRRIKCLGLDPQKGPIYGRTIQKIGSGILSFGPRKQGWKARLARGLTLILELQNFS